MLVKIKAKPKSMYLGSALITKDFEEHDIDDKLLMSEQCKHWMEIQASAPKADKKKIVEEAPKKRFKKKKDD